jgi:ribonuclease R
MNIKKEYTGRISANLKGFGFARCDDGETHFVSPAYMKELLPGDLVKFTLEKGKKPESWQIANPVILEREASAWQGVLKFENGVWVLEPDEPCFIKILVKNLSFALDSQVVSVRVSAINTPTARTNSVSATLERLLGERTRTGFDNDYVLARYDFEPCFARAVQAECRMVPSEVTPTDAHQDLRSLPFVTIDGEHTQDFDDAVYAEKTEDGYVVYVAIADVSHYVKPGSALDQCAKKRGTSVYLPGKTVPMLPEAISNGLCSLVPGKDRLVVVTKMALDAMGTVSAVKVFRAVIRSAQRLTYSEVQTWRTSGGILKATVEPSLLALWEAFEMLQGLRKARGQFNFDAPEPTAHVEDDGAIRLSWTHRTEAHKLVEELMLLTNQTVAQMLFADKQKGLFRHQPLPEMDDWAEVQEWAVTQGISLDTQPSMPEMMKLIAGVSPENTLRAELRVRNSMQPAIYHEAESAHYSLGYEAYTHFTSPIRRYADLEVHRILLGEHVLLPDLKKLSLHCSKRAKDARMAERFVWDRIKKRVLAKTVRPAERLDSHVVSYSRRGLRVVAPDWQCSLLVSAEDLLEEGLRYDDALSVWRNQSTLLDLGATVSVLLSRLEEEKTRTELHAELASPF